MKLKLDSTPPRETWQHPPRLFDLRPAANCGKIEPKKEVPADGIRTYVKTFLHNSAKIKSESESKTPLGFLAPESMPRYFRYKGDTYQVFDGFNIGRFQGLSGAIPSKLSAVTDAWMAGTLEQAFVIRPIPDSVLGDEILDSDGRIIAVFGHCINHALVPNTQQVDDYVRALKAAGAAPRESPTQLPSDP